MHSLWDSFGCTCQRRIMSSEASGTERMKGEMSCICGWSYLPASLLPITVQKLAQICVRRGTRNRHPDIRSNEWGSNASSRGVTSKKSEQTKIKAISFSVVWKWAGIQRSSIIWGNDSLLNFMLLKKIRHFSPRGFPPADEQSTSFLRMLQSDVAESEWSTCVTVWNCEYIKALRLSWSNQGNSSIWWFY